VHDPDASPKSQISFPALLPSQLKTLTVSGSRSGKHSGRLSALPDGRGTAFAPSHSFAAGEQVSVRAALGSAAAGTASGAPNATEISFTFTVAAPPPSTTAPAASSTATRLSSTQSFHSSSVRPPIVTVSTPDADLSSGDVFVDVANGSQDGPMILDGHEQIGTAADVTGGKTSYYAWYELVPSAEQKLSLAVHPGDHMSGKVTVSGTTVTVSLSDQTTGKSTTKALRMSNLGTSSAEWIAEAPAAQTSYGSYSILPLADFGSVTFTNASVTAGAHTGSLADPSWTVQRVDMTPAATSPALGGSVRISPAGLGEAGRSTGGASAGGISADGTSFTVTYSSGAAAQSSGGSAGARLGRLSARPIWLPGLWRRPRRLGLRRWLPRPLRLPALPIYAPPRTRDAHGRAGVSAGQASSDAWLVAGEQFHKRRGREIGLVHERACAGAPSLLSRSDVHVDRGEDDPGIPGELGEFVRERDSVSIGQLHIDQDRRRPQPTCRGQRRRNAAGLSHDRQAARGQ
jgi:hypothetical protein